MSNSNTSNKSQGQISNREHELCNSQENLIGNHGSILLTIYINYLWSMLWLHICCTSYPNVHALSSCLLLIYLMSYYSSTLCPITHLPYIYLKASMPYTCTLISCPKPYSSSLLSMHVPYIHHKETMLLTCSLTLLPL